MKHENVFSKIHAIVVFIFALIIGTTLTGCVETNSANYFKQEAPQTLATIDLAGDWVGELQIPNSKLRLWLVVERDPNGNLQASLDSVDQDPGKKMVVDDISIQGKELTFSIPKISAQYFGEWNQHDKQWKGRFTQGRSFDLNFARGKPKASPSYPELNGKWQTEIMGHPLVVRITTNLMGTKAVLDSPDENVRGLPISNLALDNEEISFEIPNAKVRFNGTLGQSASQFSGNWIQQGQPHRDLTFVKLVNDEGDFLKRPQHPKGKLPYQTINVNFKNNNANGVKLAGTLSMPEGDGPFPAAILISGSGPQDRDGTFMEHKTFAVLADHLTRNGIAVLRYDDRGFGESTGNFFEATSLDFASDANAAFNYLVKLDKINANAIGMIGHSEGGLIAPLASNNNKELAFIVLLAGPGVDTLNLMLAQQTAIARVENIPAQKLQGMLRVSRQIMETVRDSDNEETAIKSLSKLLTKEKLALIDIPPDQKIAILESYTRPWYRYFLTYSPEEHFNDKSLPILALNGDLDVQVTAQENLGGLTDILRDHKDATIRLLPGLNHMFQKATTGSISEYRQIDQTFSPEALSIITHWLNERF